MINHEQIKEMIDCYGANLDRWPCAEKKAIAVVIENDVSLLNAFLEARQLDQSIDELFEMSEPEWTKDAEKKLSAKIVRQLDFSGEAKREATWWSKLDFLVNKIKSYKIKPVVPAALAALVLLATVQLNFQGNGQLLENSHLPYSVAELDEWLVLEGLDSVFSQEVQQTPDELAILEPPKVEFSLDSEFIFYL